MTWKPTPLRPAAWLCRLGRRVPPGAARPLLRPGAQPARHPPAALFNPFAPARPLKQGPHSAYSQGEEGSTSGPLEERAADLCRRLEEACPEEFRWEWGEERTLDLYPDDCTTTMTRGIGDFCTTGPGHSHLVYRLNEPDLHCGTECIYCGENPGGCEAALVEELVAAAGRAGESSNTFDAYGARVWSSAAEWVETTCCE